MSSVEVDQLLNTLDAPTVRNFKRTVRGLADSYRGVGATANRGFRYLNPYLSTSRRVVGELVRDESRLRRLITDTARFSTVLAQRAPNLSRLVSNVNLATGAIGRQRAALTEAIERLPGFLRLSNTTFVNLRAAADDLEPLLVATRPVAERLRPLLPLLRATAADSVPTIRGLDAIAVAARPGQRSRRAAAADDAALAGGDRARRPRLRRRPERGSRPGSRRRLSPGRARRGHLHAGELAAGARPPAGLQPRAGRLVRRLRHLRGDRRQRRHRPHRRHLQRLFGRAPTTGCPSCCHLSIPPSCSAPAEAARSSTSATCAAAPAPTSAIQATDRPRSMPAAT